MTTHPRVCGEHPSSGSSQSRSADSSPRVRGARGRCPRERCRGRLIPACAGSTRPQRRTGRSSPTHPRVCGEHQRRGPRSPRPPTHPRVCGGARLLCSLRQRLARLIPACAGSTPPPPGSPAATSTHPRVCGEHAYQDRGHGGDPTHPRVCGEHNGSLSGNSSVNDSSPRVRGALLLAERTDLLGRLIPACAGSTPAARPCGATPATHPRVCGEHHNLNHAAEFIADSSPRVRGALPRPRSPCHPRRLIPACAGSTSEGASSEDALTTHPRVCGEHVHDDVLADPGFDSSPRVRGAHQQPPTEDRHPRLIPACAGSTPTPPPQSPTPPTHPRVCGEHAGGLDAAAGLNDSSPRVRGAQPDEFSSPSTVRLIPACAGSTPYRHLYQRHTTTHPRVCGEHVSAPSGSSSHNDSSPRVRGAHQLDGDVGPGERLIPACAGSTCRHRPGRAPTTTHPRVCGEHSGTSMLTPTVVDSSPACAGSTSVHSRGSSGNPTHPRVCGEHR